MPPAVPPPEPTDAYNPRIVAHPILGPLPAAPEILFAFDGRSLPAREGEPVIAALLAAGVRVFRTMPGSGEARGGYCLVGRCSDCLVVIDGRPNQRACVTPVRAGLEVATQRGLGEDAWSYAGGAWGDGNDAEDDRWDGA